MIAHRTGVFLNDLHILVQLKSTLQLGPFFRETSSPVLKDIVIKCVQAVLARCIAACVNVNSCRVPSPDTCLSFYLFLSRDLDIGDYKRWKHP